MSQGCADRFIGRYPLRSFILVGSANLGTLYNLCLSSVIFLRIFIHSVVYINISIDLFICLVYMGLIRQSSIVVLMLVGGWGGGGAYLGLAFIVSFFAGGCSYVIGTLLLSNGELSCIVAFSFRL